MSPPPPPVRRPGGPAAPAAATAADPVVQRFMAAMRVHGMYPKGNPNVATALNRLREALAAFAPGEGIQLEVDQNQIRFGDLPVLPQAQEVRDLANRLYLAHVASIVLLPEASAEEIGAAFELLRLPPDERAALGPFDELLPARGARHVIVREAGRTKVEEVADDPDSWDLSSLAEFEELEQQVFGQMGKTEFKEMLRAVTSGQKLRASRLLGMLERPRAFAQYLVDLASRVRPRDRIDLGSQLAVMLALVDKMEAVLEKLPEPDQIHLFVKLDQVAAWLSTAIHKAPATSPSGWAGQGVGPFARLGDVAALFPETVRDLDLREAFAIRKPVGPGLAPALVGGLRRIARGDEELTAFVSAWTGAPVAPDAKALAAYAPAALPMGSPDAPPRALPPDFLMPGPTPAAPAPGVPPPPVPPSVAMTQALGRALAAAVPALDVADTLVDLLALEREPAARQVLLAGLTDAFRRALEARNVRAATAVLAALRAEAGREPRDPASRGPAEAALAEAAGRASLDAYARLLGEVVLGGEEHRLAVELARDLGAPAIPTLLEVLAAEEDRSTRRRLLDLLMAIGAPHLKLIAAQAEHAQWFVVRNVVAVLGAFGPPALPAIAAAATNAEPRVRREVVRSYARIAPAAPEAVRALLRLLEDRDEGVVREAALKAASFRTPQSAASLGALARSPRFAELEADTILAVARALGAVGEADAATLLDGLAEAKSARGWLRAPEVRKGLQDAAAAVRARTAPGAAPGRAAGGAPAGGAP